MLWQHRDFALLLSTFRLDENARSLASGQVDDYTINALYRYTNTWYYRYVAITFLTACRGYQHFKSSKTPQACRKRGLSDVQILAIILRDGSYVLSGEPCPICLEVCSETAKAALGCACNQAYHPKCLLAWRKQKNTCPTCRQHITRFL